MAQTERTLREQSNELAVRAESIASDLDGVVYGIEASLFGPSPVAPSNEKEGPGGDSIEGDLGRISRALSRIQQSNDDANRIRRRLVQDTTVGFSEPPLPRTSRF